MPLLTISNERINMETTGIDWSIVNMEEELRGLSNERKEGGKDGISKNNYGKQYKNVGNAENNRKYKKTERRRDEEKGGKKSERR